MSLFFALVLGAHVAGKLWLSRRQVQYVGERSAAVPPEFALTIGLDDHRRAASYTIAKQRLVVLEVLAGAAGFLCLTWLGGLQWIADSLAPWLGTGLVFELALVAAVVALLGLVDLPLQMLRQFGIEERFGFNRMSPAMFAGDVLKSLALALVLGLPLLAAVLALMRWAGGAWWLAAWLCWVAFSLVLSLLYPALIAPLFNRFTPLPEGPLRERIGALLSRTGFRSSGVYTMDGSRRSSHGNAYFTGMGPAKRIVFYDTLIERLYPEEIEAVLAHELGHFRLHHVRWRIVSGMLVALAWLALLAWLQRQSWFAPSLGVHLAPTLPANAMALVLFGLVAPLFSFVLAPVQSALSRRQEFAADAFAARQVSANCLARALVKLYQDNASTLTPDPLHSAFYDSHPPALIRIDRLQAAAPAGAAG